MADQSSFTSNEVAETESDVARALEGASAVINGDTDDNFRIVPSDSGTLTVDVTNISAPVDLHLYTADGTRLTSSRNDGIADEQITFDLDANVAYVIAVTPVSGSAQGF